MSLWTLLGDKLLASRTRAHGRRAQKHLRDRIRAHQDAEAALDEKDADAYKEAFIEQITAIENATDDIENVAEKLFQEEKKLLSWDQQEIDDVRRDREYARNEEDIRIEPDEFDETLSEEKQLAQSVETDDRELLGWTTRLAKGAKPLNFNKYEYLEHVQQEDTVAREIYNASWQARKDIRNLSDEESEFEDKESDIESDLASDDAEQLRNDLQEAHELFTEVEEALQAFEETEEKFLAYAYTELYSFIKSRENILNQMYNNRGKYYGFTREYIPPMDNKRKEIEQKIEQILAQRDLKDKIQRIISEAQHIQT